VLTGKLASAYIEGVQNNDVVATIKHFVGNESSMNATPARLRSTSAPCESSICCPSSTASETPTCLRS